VADVSDATAMEGLAAQVVAEHGRVNLLFNNAGITYAKRFENHTLADWERIIGINLWGVIHGCHFFLPHLREQAGRAHIVNLSSMVAFMGPPEQTSYTATKAAIKGFSESLWAELHGDGIGVTVVHPGAIRTHIMDEALKSADDRDAFARTKAMVERMAMPADRAARKILKAVRQDRMRVVVGADAALFENAKRALPESANKLFLLMRH
jgi:short-subunit dehydrogenase